MINGYEEIYGVHHKDKKKYEVLDTDKLAHDIWNCLTDTPLGISTTEVYVSIVEQHIGKDAYKALRSVYSDYDTLIEDIVEYQQKVAQYKQFDSEKKDIQNKIASKITQVKEYEEKLDDFLENGEEANVRRNIRAEYEKFSSEKAKETNTINELVSEEFDKTAKLAELKPLIQSLKRRIMQKYERLIANKKNLEGVNLNKFDKFIDTDFEVEIQQDFVDSCLLPGEERKEDLYRKMADTKFQMMKMEATYLLDSIDASQQLMEELRDNQLKISLPQEIVDRRSTLKGMNYASTGMIEEFDYAFTQEPFNDYYLYMANLFKNMNYGANWVEGAEKYYATGVDMGIPDRRYSTIKHKIGELTGKIKVNYGYNMGMVEPLVRSFDKMKGGVKFDFEQLKEQNVGMSV